LSSRGLKARGDPLWTSKRTALIQTRPLHTVDCRVVHLRFFLAMTNVFYTVLKPHTGFISTPCHREGVARGDPLGNSKRTALIRMPPSRHSGLPRRSLRFPPRNDKGRLDQLDKNERSYP